MTQPVRQRTSTSSGPCQTHHRPSWAVRSHIRVVGRSVPGVLRSGASSQQKLGVGRKMAHSGPRGGGILQIQSTCLVCGGW